MLALPHLSGSEFISLLVRLGFRPRRRAGGLVTLRRHAAVVTVPEAGTLAPVVVGAILRAASVDPLDFLHVMQEGVRVATPVPPKSAPAVI